MRLAVAITGSDIIIDNRDNRVNLIVHRLIPTTRYFLNNDWRGEVADFLPPVNSELGHVVRQTRIGHQPLPPGGVASRPFERGRIIQHLLDGLGMVDRQPSHQSGAAFSPRHPSQYFVQSPLVSLHEFPL